MIRRGWMARWPMRKMQTWSDDEYTVTLPAADFDRLLALLEECAGDLECEISRTSMGDPQDMDLPRRVRALLKEVGDGEG
jgi:hypothetical protein